MNTIPDTTPYFIIDCHTKTIIHRGTYAERVRIRRLAERKNLAYGAYRYATRSEDTTK